MFFSVELEKQAGQQRRRDVGVQHVRGVWVLDRAHHLPHLASLVLGGLVAVSGKPLGCIESKTIGPSNSIDVVFYRALVRYVSFAQ